MLFYIFPGNALFSLGPECVKANPTCQPSFSSKISVTWKGIQSEQIIKGFLKKGLICSCLWTPLKNICHWGFPNEQ